MASKPLTVVLRRRMIEFPVMVTTFVEEFNLRVYSFIKEFGVHNALVDPLFCEAGLWAPSFACIVDKKLLEETMAVRAAVRDLVEDPEKASGDKIKAVLPKHRPHA